MDPPRRTSRVIDPKVRHVGFFAPLSPGRTQSGPPAPAAPSPVSGSPSGNSLSPVMIPPPRHASDNLSSALALHQPPSRPVSVPVTSAVRRPSIDNVAVVGSYNQSETVLATSPSAISPSSRIGDGEFSEDSLNWIRRTNSGKFSSSVPTGGFDLAVKKAQEVFEKGGGKGPVISNELASNAKPLKDKMTKAERRAMQESQRAAKAAAKGSSSAKEGRKPAAASGVAPFHEQTAKGVKQPSQKKDIPPVAPSIAASEKKGGDRPPEKDRKKDVPPPRMQFDDKNRVEKAKRRAVVKQTEARNRVELFRHLPQYEHGTRLPDLEAKFFQLDPMHPAVYKVGLQYLAGDVFGGNARCIAMLQAFREAINDYCTPAEKTLARDLTAKINSYVSYFIECRPLSISMGNAIRFLKARIAKLPLNLSESDAKATLCSEIDRFIKEKIVLADKVIVRHAVTKIRDGDVLLTYGSSSVVEMILLYAHELGKQFRVVIVDSRPKLEGQALLRRLVGKGLSCTYTHINAISYIMHEVTKVLLGAASVLSNGTVYSRVGTACVAMVAHEFQVPVLICCEAYKFHERVQLDSICSNELGDPDVISKVPGRMDVNYLDNWANKDNLQLLNLLYDATPSDYISMIITDYGMVPPTSVPVIVREYGKELLLI
ncbi:Translation initiation factor eIF-2B subunit delta like [Actinidia chinensis var. chinensis]|uniref:Translation initiation factor eIF2B subunit delta n=1 Tax=Actinidia chinensis var. chinensis TaxID=1590841 RepID=A0A2R6PU29_ACTCC|nr:Translation initiation factor eIF-2B subunit delta like [Actinidia chinensis var. chinensis]